MKLVFGQSITHDKMRLAQSLQQTSVHVITVPDDQLTSNFIIWPLYHFKSYSKNQIHMTYNGKVICTFVVLPHKTRF